MVSVERGKPAIQEQKRVVYLKRGCFKNYEKTNMELPGHNQMVTMVKAVFRGAKVVATKVYPIDDSYKKL